MDLFDELPHPSQDPKHNWLPCDGEVYYHGVIMSKAQADAYYQQLLVGIDWQSDRAEIYGKSYTTRRKVAWHGSQPFQYTYSGVTKTAWPWTDTLLQIKQMIEANSDTTYNSCLLNLYNDGQDGMAWHSDGERDLQRHGAIASVSLGVERKFAFKHKGTGKKVELVLGHGSLLVMQGTTQEHWLHRLPPTTKINQPRVNLTFRTIVSKS